MQLIIDLHISVLLILVCYSCLSCDMKSIMYTFLSNLYDPGCILLPVIKNYKTLGQLSPPF